MGFKILLLAALVATTMASGDVEKVSKANSAFTNKVFEQLIKKDGNVFFSPISMHAVLSMAFQGAGGSTVNDFTKVLGVDMKTAADGYSGVLSTLNSVENVTLLMANKIYLMEKYSMKENFKNAVTKTMKSEVEPINFAQQQSSADNINGWCRAKTNNKIDKLVKADDLGADTRMVLLNAIYFKGDWLHKFNKDATQKKPFYVTPTAPVDVDMMFISKKFKYGMNEALDSQILEMKYTNEAVSMVIILPNEKDGIKALEQKLINYDLTTLTNNLYETTVDVSLPKFKIETEMDLKDVWSAMGLGKIFKDPDFSGMLESPEPLVVSKAIQKAFIEVNEEGAEAAAVTGMMMMRMCIPITQNFTADHPFILILRTKTGDIIHDLFYGKIMQPSYE